MSVAGAKAWLPHVLFIAILGTAAGIRWRLLAQTQYPTGLDGGNWLAFGHSILGEQLRSPTLRYPPVVPLLAVASEHLFGSYRGLQILELMASLAPPTAMYILLIAWQLGWRAALFAGFIAASAATGDAMAWGGYPQLIALALMLLFVLALERFLSGELRFATVAPPAALSFLALATSEFIGPVTVLVGVLYAIGRLALAANTPWQDWVRKAGALSTLTIVISLPLAPTYLALIPGVTNHEQTRLTSQPGLIPALGTFRAITSDFPNFWLLGLAASVIVPLFLFTRLRKSSVSAFAPLALLTASLLLLSAILLVAVGEDRFAYLIPVAIAVGLAAWSRVFTVLPTWALTSFEAALVACLMIDVVVGTQYFAVQRSYYALLTPGVAQGISQLNVVSSGNELVAVSPAAHNWELGWWVEGVDNRRTIYAGDPYWLYYTDERRRNAIANELFAATGVDESRLLAAKVGVSVLFVDKAWPEYATWRGHADLNSDYILYENRAVLIVSCTPTSANRETSSPASE